jgi:intracellular sulfur oxidation DsrE/DsrF family protein
MRKYLSVGLLAAAGLAVGAGMMLGQAVGQAEPDEPVPIEIEDGIRVVYQIKTDNWKEGEAAGLHYMAKLRDQYRQMGLADERFLIVGVHHGDAAYQLLNDAAYADETGEDANPNEALIADLVESGVRVEICSQTMESHGWTEDDLQPGVIMVVAAYPRVIDLQHQGYAYIRF